MTTTVGNDLAAVTKEAVSSAVGSPCDAKTGVCALPGPAPKRAEPAADRAGGEVLYVGDPMCSACWGISPALRQLEAETTRRGMSFRILVGGLRPGGGDPWTEEFRDFLRHHWEETGARTGQPFSTRFLDRADFAYDTEPSCRAFVVMRELLREKGGSAAGAYELFAAIQRKFYVDSEDPTDTAFYRSLCAEYGLDFPAFVSRFAQADAKRATAAEFQESRALGVRGFPTVLYRDGANARLLAIGYATGSGLVDALDAATASMRR